MKKRARNVWNEWKGELLVTALFAPLFLFLMDTGYLYDLDLIPGVTLGVLGAEAVWAAVLLLKKKMTWERGVLLLVAAGVILRMGYVLSTHYLTRSHDCGDIYWYVYGHSEDLDVNDFGHGPYIMYMYLNRQLPHFNQGQFYHPPLFHTLAAMVMWVTYKLLKIEDLIYLLSAAQVVSCLASCYALLMVPKICRELRIRKAGKCVVTAIMAFLPMFVLMASWINNDGLVFYFMTWIVLYTIRWYQKPSWGNTLMLALGFGLGMMSKASCALLAFFTGAVMILRLIRTVKKSAAKKEWNAFWAMVLRFAGFAAVAFPLGLFYPIRNLIKFDQPLNYVLRLNIAGVPVWDFWSRFVAFPFTRLFEPVFARYDEYNLNLFLLKTSSFGEFGYPEALEPWGLAILSANLILILLSFVAVVRVAGTTRQLFWRFVFPGIWILLYVSEVTFSQKFPFTCTMDARYMTPTILIGALYLGKLLERKPVGKASYCYRILCICATAVLGVAGIYFITHAGPSLVWQGIG